MTQPRVVYLCRHGQSEFNEAFARDRTCDPMIRDPLLTEVGKAQALRIGHALASIPVELVVTSPFRRALQTAQLAFSSRLIPTVVGPLHRERLEQSCDIGTPSSLLRVEYVDFDFEHVEETWWHVSPTSDAIEPEDIVNDRVQRFRLWLESRAERCIVVVGHGGFFRRMTGYHFENGECFRLKADLSTIEN